MRLSSVVIRVTAQSERFAGVAGSLYCSRRTRGQTDGRSCAGPALLFDGLAGVRGVALAARPCGVQTGPPLPFILGPFLYTTGARTCTPTPRTARRVYVSLRPETHEVVMELSKCLDADAPSGSDSYTPVSLSPLTIANQDGRTQNWASAN